MAPAAGATPLYVLPTWVNLRAEADPASPVVSELKQATEVVEVGRKGGWVQVRVPARDGVGGWIDSSFLGTSAPAQP